MMNCITIHWSIIINSITDKEYTGKNPPGKPEDFFVKKTFLCYDNHKEVLNYILYKR